MLTFIAIPCLDMVHTAFLHSLLSLQPDGGEVRFGISASSLVYDARNNLLQQAINAGADRILWLDSDMVFAPDLLQRLSEDMDTGLDYVSALYFTRKEPVEPTIYGEFGYNQHGRELIPYRKVVKDYPENSLFQIKGSGFGAVLITVKLAKDIFSKYGAPFSPQPGFGEDLSFCIRADGVGAKLWCDSRVKVGHAGQIIIDEQRYKEGLRL